MKKGQIVYILGRYRARVCAILPDGHISCMVYEGLPDGEKKMYLTYNPMFVEEERRKPVKQQSYSRPRGK